MTNPIRSEVDLDADGFNIAAVVNPGSFADIADLLVPELQRRGVYKRAYREGTLREKLFGREAGLADTHYGSLFRI